MEKYDDKKDTNAVPNPLVLALCLWRDLPGLDGDADAAVSAVALIGAMSNAQLTQKRE